MRLLHVCQDTWFILWFFQGRRKDCWSGPGVIGARKAHMQFSIMINRRKSGPAKTGRARSARLAPMPMFLHEYDLWMVLYMTRWCLWWQTMLHWPTWVGIFSLQTLKHQGYLKSRVTNSLFSQNYSAIFFGVWEKADFWGTWTSNLQLSTLMLYLLSQEAHPVSTATSSLNTT